jgi:hypothetical protein
MPYNDNQRDDSSDVGVRNGLQQKPLCTLPVRVPRVETKHAQSTPLHSGHLLQYCTV